MKNKIAYIVEEVFETGPVFQLRELIRGLSSDNFETEVVSLSPYDQDSTFFGDSANLHTLPRSRFALLQGLELRKRIEEIQPNVVHSWGVATRLQSAIASWSREPVHITSVFEQPQDHQSLIMRSANWFASDELVANHPSILDGLQQAGAKCDRVIRPTISNPHTSSAAQHIDSAAPLNNSESTHASSDSARNKLLALMGKKSNERIWLAGAVTGFEPRYRLKDLVWAIDILCCVRKDIHLIIFGNGCDQGILNYISKLDCADNVHLLPIDQQKMELIAGLDIFWNSQTVCPVPPAMLFAMQRQVPVVSVLGDETKEYVLPMQTALATNYGARDEFARWTKYLIELPDAAKQIGIQARQHVENMLINSSMVDAYSKLYIDLIRKS